MAGVWRSELERLSAVACGIVGFTMQARIISLLAIAIALAACAPPGPPVTENLKLTSLRGTRDGDRLDARAEFSDGSTPLAVDLHFRIGAPTELTSGSWPSGSVRARSVTFLGGQNSSPSIGGTFELLGPDGKVRYVVRIPVTELRTRL